MVNPIYQQGEELLLNQFGSKYLGVAAHTNVNSNEFIVQEDAVISVLTGGDSSTAANDVDYKASMSLSGVTLKQGALIVAPQGESFQSITIDSGTIMAYNSVVGGTKPGAVPLLLDLYPDASAAYSLRKLRTDYTGAAIEVRKTVGGETSIQDIGFVNGELDTTSLLSFANGEDVFVAKWYDQSGAGKNAAQVSQSSQPQIVSSGLVIKVNDVAAVDFDGTNNYLETDTFTEIPQPTSYFGVFKFDESKNQNIFDGSIANRQLIGGSDTTYKLFAGIQITGGITNTNQNSFNGILSTTDSLFINNISVISGNAGSGEIDEIVMGSNIFRNGGFLNGKIQELIFYPSDQSANRLAIESNINKNYNIYWDGSQTGLLDDYPSATAAYSLRALNSSYTGPAIEARKTVAGETFVQNIGFLYDGSLDTESLLSFADGGDVFVAKWYDQSGAGNNDATQISASKQPILVSNGAVNELNGKPTMNFLAPFLMDLNLTQYPFTSGGSATEKSIFAVAENNGTTNQNLYNIADARDIYALTYNRSANNTYGFLGANYGAIGGNITGQNIISSFAISPSSKTFNNSVEGLSSNLLRANFNDISIGSRGGSYAMDGNIQEFVMYESDQSANREGIEANINTHYTIY